MHRSILPVSSFLSNQFGIETRQEVENDYSQKTFYRTNLELKLSTKRWRVRPSRPFYRTNLELKQDLNNVSNDLKRPFYRTNLELKPTTKIRSHVWLFGFLSNQFGIETQNDWYMQQADGRLFIEPIWNWNRANRVFLSPCSMLFIEPIWNWNSF